MIKINQYCLNLAGIAFLAFLLSSCASVETNIESSEQLSQAAESADGTLVFGKVRWIYNGEELDVGVGLSSNVVELQMYPMGSDKRIIGRIGEGGRFAWTMSPGHYHVPAANFVSPMFSSRGNFVGYTYLEFDVPDVDDPVYLGTLMLETEYTRHLFTWDATLKASIVDDCEADCEDRLADLGLPVDTLRVNLIRFDSRLSSLRSGE